VPSQEPPDYEACDVCGRSFLRGERGLEFVTPDREARLVCTLCGERAEGLGWVRADMVGEEPTQPAPRRRGLLNLRLREPFGRPHEDPEPPAEEPDAEPQVAAEPRAVPDTPERRIHRAVESFNESEAPRLVAGLTRSLGAPRAAIRELQGPLRAEITIAWELSWYRWEIGQNGGGEPRQVAKGAEVEELAADELDWNAGVDEEGRLQWPESS
jgi:hypothetical protein